jgi:phosphatidate cytidylyltransferase
MAEQNLGQGDKKDDDRLNRIDSLVSKILPPDDEEIVLPHWSDPPTGEIPRVVLEMSGDKPLWLDPSTSSEDLLIAPEKEPEKDREGDRALGSRAGSSRNQQGSFSGAGVGFDDGLDLDKLYEPPPANSDDLMLDNPGMGEPATNKSYRKVRIPRNSSASKGSGRVSSEKGLRSRPKRPPVSTAEGDDVEMSGGSDSESERPMRSKFKRSASGGRSKSKSIFTGIVLGALVLGALAAGPKVSAGLVAVALVVAAAEYYSNVQKAKMKPAKLVGLVSIVLMSIGGYVQGMQGVLDALLLGVVVTFLWYLVGLLHTPALEGVSVSLMPLLWIGLLGSFASLILRPQDFHGYGVRLLLAVLITTTSADTFAYFGGAFLGRRKLAPSVSPSKTLEGVVIGALAAVLLGAFIAGAIFPMNLEKGAVLGLVAGLVTPLGDLCESMIKRSLNVKDTSNLLPGHGGVLDRIDGVLFMLPTAYFLFQLFHLG